jgi:hypothetical protein
MFMTFLIAKEIYPKMRAVWVRKDQPTIERNTYPTWEKISPGSVKADKRGDAKNPRIEFAKGAELIFFGENYEKDKELNRWKGLEANWFLIDEINELQYKSFLKAIERRGSYICPDGKTPNGLIIATCNPTQNWVKEKIYNRWREGTLPPDWLYIPAKITDNPYITQQYKDALKELPRYEYEVYVNGNWDVAVKTGGEFYRGFDLERHVHGDILYNSDLPLHLSMDFNVHPAMHAVVCQIEGNQIRVIDEIVSRHPDNTTRGLCREFDRRYRGHTAGLYLYGDPAGKAADTRSEKGVNDFRIAEQGLERYRPSLRVLSKHPNVKARGDFINAVFSRNIYGLEIVVAADCHGFIKDLVSGKEAPDGSKLKERERNPSTGATFEKYHHLSDAFDYLMCYAFASEFDRYTSGDLAERYLIGDKKPTGY